MKGFTFPSLSKSILIILTYVFLQESCLCKANDLRTGITYKIRSGLDGSFLTSHYPSFAPNLTLKLGPVTTQEYWGTQGQLWTLNKLSNNKTTEDSDLFWARPGAAVLNEVTGIPKEREIVLEIREITMNSGTYIVRNVDTNQCLTGRGDGEQIFFGTCEELSVAQQWDFEDPNRLDGSRFKTIINERIKYFFANLINLS